MKSRILRLAGTVTVLQLVIGISVASAFDDSFLKLQQEQFKLQRQLQQQQSRFQQQQFKLDRQLRDQQFRTQRQLRRQESYSRNLSSYSPSSKWYVSTPSFDPMSGMRSQMRTSGFNVNPLTNSLNRDLIKSQDQPFRVQRQLREQQGRWPQYSPASWLREYQASTVSTDRLGQRNIVTAMPLFSAAWTTPLEFVSALPAFSSRLVPAWFNKPAVGMTREAATFALSGMREGGGHAMRHWVEGGLIPNKYSVGVRREVYFRPNAQAIIEDPLMTFKAKLGPTRATGYLGRGVRGKWDKYQAVFVASEGRYKGRVISAYPDVRLDQQVKWGVSKWHSSENLSMSTASQMRAVQGGLMVLDATLTAAQTFVQTMDYVGRSMQAMNPPVYLQENARFTPSQRLLLIPVSGTREGSGTYSIPGGWAGYHEVLSTGGPGPITRVHTEWSQTEYGSHYRRVRTETPSTNAIERFMMTHYPLGSYWDENSTVSYTTQGSSYSWRETNIGGVMTITPLRTFDANRNFGTFNNNFGVSSGFNNWISQPTFKNNFGGYGNYTISQPKFNDNFGRYGN